MTWQCPASRYRPERAVHTTCCPLNHELSAQSLQEVRRFIHRTKHSGDRHALIIVKRAVYVGFRSEEHTSELQSLMRISYAVFCLKKNNIINDTTQTHIQHKHYNAYYIP